jgi:hypothetical protein
MKEFENPGMLIKLEIDEAYNKVDDNFLGKVLRKFGFREN